jgi:hypothetical protein
MWVENKTLAINYIMSKQCQNATICIHKLLFIYILTFYKDFGPKILPGIRILPLVVSIAMSL